MWRSPPPKGILGDLHLAHMIASSVPSSKDLSRSESVRPTKQNTRSSVALAVGISRNWRAMTAIRGNRACPTSLHQTRTSTSWVMSDPSSFLPITTLLWITDIWNQSCISSLVLSTSDICDICGEFFLSVKQTRSMYGWQDKLKGLQLCTLTLTVCVTHTDTHTGPWVSFYTRIGNTVLEFIEIIRTSTCIIVTSHLKTQRNWIVRLSLQNNFYILNKYWVTGSSRNSRFNKTYLLSLWSLFLDLTIQYLTSAVM